MQTIYAMHQNGSDDLIKQEKFLLYSIDSIQDLYLTMISSLMAICKKETEFLHKSSLKHLATKAEVNPNKKFVNNSVFKILEENNSLSIALETRKIDAWYLNNEYIVLLLNAIKESKTYQDYMNNPVQSFEEDKQLIVDIFTNIIVTNEKIYEHLEDDNISWIDDIPLVNTLIVKQLKALKPIEEDNFSVPKVYKDSEDKDFAKDLFKKTVLNEKDLAKKFADKTPNWDADRIAEIDTIILKMAVCEFTKFPSIPVKVTLNEYLELAKEYSTPKSSLFINGILDSIVKDLEANKTLVKTGRGLM